MISVVDASMEAITRLINQERQNPIKRPKFFFLKQPEIGIIKSKEGV